MFYFLEARFMGSNHQAVDILAVLHLSHGLEIFFGDRPATGHRNSKTAMNDWPCWMETDVSFGWVCVPPSWATRRGT